jgi:hypothetical protein
MRRQTIFSLMERENEPERKKGKSADGGRARPEDLVSGEFQTYRRQENPADAGRHESTPDPPASVREGFLNADIGMPIAPAPSATAG